MEIKLEDDLLTFNGKSVHIVENKEKQCRECGCTDSDCRQCTQSEIKLTWRENEN